MKFYISGFFENLCRKFQFHSNRLRIMDTLHEGHRYTFLIVSRLILLGMKNVSDKSCRENQSTRFVFLQFFLIGTVNEKTWKDIIERGRPQMTWRMRIACWIPKATNTHSGCLILIVFPTMLA